MKLSFTFFGERKTNERELLVTPSFFSFIRVEGGEKTFPLFLMSTVFFFLLGGRNYFLLSSSSFARYNFLDILLPFPTQRRCHYWLLVASPCSTSLFYSHLIPYSILILAAVEKANIFSGRNHCGEEILLLPTSN
jgi:hypothetical protein